MPHIVQGEPGGQTTTFTKDYKYDYSGIGDGDLDFTPGSKLHVKLVALILERANLSNKTMSTRFDSWNEIDKTLTAYITADADEEKIKNIDERKPISIVFPYSYAMLETLLTYLFVAFVQEPIFRYEGSSPEDTVGTALMEMAINVQCIKNKVGLGLHTLFRDSLGYGIGVGGLDWRVKRGFKMERVDDVDVGPSKRRIPTVLFEGNALNNIDPYRYLPDPNFAIQRQQEAEFQGWVTTENYHNLIREEANGDGLFNAKYIKEVMNKRSIYGVERSARNDKSGWTRDQTIADSKVATDIIYCQIDLIPKDWELGASTEPERWQFALAADSVIIEARPTKFNHDMFPIATCAPDFDGYSTIPISRLEIIYGLQGVGDFLFNSHIANVRKAVNDMWVVDPQQVNIKDIENPKPGKIIRLRRPAWGRGVKDVLAQFPVNDVTRANIPDSSYVANLMEKIMGTDSSMSGSLRQGGPERLTKSEFQGTRQGGVQRLERMAKVMGYQAMQDIGEMFASHTQQLMEEDVFAKITGRWTQEMYDEYGVNAGTSPDRMKVNPYDILVNYDLLVRDGSIPGGNFSEAELTLFNTVVQADPDVRQNFDVVRIFEHIAKRLGWKNIRDFRKNVDRIQPQVQSDENVANEVQKGNLIPVGA